MRQRGIIRQWRLSLPVIVNSLLYRKSSWVESYDFWSSPNPVEDVSETARATRTLVKSGATFREIATNFCLASHSEAIAVVVVFLCLS